MYHVGRPLAGVANAASLVAEGTSPLLAIAGGIGAIALGIRAVQLRKDNAPEAVSPPGRRAAAGGPGGLVAFQSAMLAAGKPGEFGRFLLVPDIFLGVEAVVAVATFVRPCVFRPVAIGVLGLGTAAAGGVYVRGFVRDSGPVTSRLAAAETLRQLQERGDPHPGSHGRSGPVLPPAGGPVFLADCEGAHGSYGAASAELECLGQTR